MRSTRLHWRHLPLSVGLFDGSTTLEPTWEGARTKASLPAGTLVPMGPTASATPAMARKLRVAPGGRTRWCPGRAREHCALALLTLASLAISAAFPVPAVGSSPQEPDGAPAPDSAAASMNVVRALEPPVMDGIVDESSWTLADVATNFLQREPREGQPATERTEVRILYDDENLYVSLIAYDSDPSAIIATELRRDAIGHQFRRSDDTFTVLLDTFNDGRSAFQFTVNPLGTRYDATIRNESEVNSDWDEAWEAAAQITSRGWEAELVIPLRILRYSSGASDWGVDFERQILRKNEQVAWSNYRRDFQFIAVSQAGDLRGFQNLSVTQRFRLRPYFLGTVTSLFEDPGRTNNVDEQLGIDDLKIQLTSNLTADLTYNTDFAQVELDEQRVNLTRFDLFFPEKRDFFLEGANNFSFGQQSGLSGGFDGPVLQLFHSRNIGLSEFGEPLPIDFGVKMTGKVGSGNIGLLNVQTGDSDLGEGRNYTALRWRQDILERSSVGALVTNVEGPDGATNTVIGADVNFTFLDHLNISAFGARATTDSLADDLEDIDADHFRARATDDLDEEGKYAGQFRIGWQSDLWTASVDVMRIDPGFRSDLGFVLREDVVRRDYLASFNPRPDVSWLRSVTFDTFFTTFHDTRGDLVTRQGSAGAFLNFESGDAIGVAYLNTFERLDFPFQIHPEVTIPPGEYEFNSLDVFAFTFDGRRISAATMGTFGQFFDGTILSLSPQVTIRFSEKLQLSPAFSYNKIDLPGGSFTSNVLNARANYSFSDRWLTDALVQYNNLFNTVSIFARLRYIYRIGDDIYLVYRQAGEYDGFQFGRHDRTLTLKVTRSFDW